MHHLAQKFRNFALQSLSYSDIPKTSLTLKQACHRVCWRTPGAYREPVLFLYSDWGNSWDVFRGLRPCHFLAAFVSPPSRISQIKCNPPCYLDDKFCMWSCGVVPCCLALSSNLHAKVVNHSLVVHTEERQPGMPTHSNVIYMTGRKEEGGGLHIFHL